MITFIVNVYYFSPFVFTYELHRIEIDHMQMNNVTSVTLFGFKNLYGMYKIELL